MGFGQSTDISAGARDLFYFRVSHAGALDFFASYGGTNEDYATDMELYGSFAYLNGYSESVGLTQGNRDIFLVKTTKASATLQWSRFIGTINFNEVSRGIAVDTSGNVYGVGQIEDTSFTNGGIDMFLFGIYSDGNSYFAAHAGSGIDESPGGIVYNSAISRFYVGANSGSTSFTN